MPSKNYYKTSDPDEIERLQKEGNKVIAISSEKDGKQFSTFDIEDKRSKDTPKEDKKK